MGASGARFQGRDDKLREYHREYKRQYRKCRKEQDGITPEAAYYHRKKSDPEFIAKRKQYSEQHKNDPETKAYHQKYFREVAAARLRERWRTDPEWAERKRAAGREAYAKRKADPIRYAAFLALNKERSRKYSREVLPELHKDPEGRERLRQKSKRFHEKRKADPVRYAAFLAKRREYQRRRRQRVKRTDS